MNVSPTENLTDCPSIAKLIFLGVENFGVLDPTSYFRVKNTDFKTNYIYCIQRIQTLM
jgi:hypothetical protein